MVGTVQYGTGYLSVRREATNHAQGGAPSLRSSSSGHSEENKQTTVSDDRRGPTTYPFCGKARPIDVLLVLRSKRSTKF